MLLNRIFASLAAQAEWEGFEPSIGFTLYSLSRGAPSASRPPLLFVRDYVVKEEEAEGFEPSVLSYNGFQDRRLKPLGHASRSTEGRGS